ncbi:hypothetical protein UFOVP704_53 [uncultured Caudovirales phage]|uniref:Uncharacterized protein n=1 Tax=uncultured Caudovirales phage TaxID=2100421 RepID=A0A6J5NH77_9CAUD|nr:hypothetical protein UFOVP704_53 [uncultured Caudovirales phage]
MALPSGLATPDSASSSLGGVSGPGKSKAIVSPNTQQRGALSPVNAPFNFVAQRVTSSTTLDSGQLILQVNAAAAAVVLTLPRAYYANGQFIHIIKTDATANQVSAIAQAGDTLGKATAKAWPVAQYETVTLVSQVDSSGLGIWYVLQ